MSEDGYASGAWWHVEMPGQPHVSTHGYLCVLVDTSCRVASTGVLFGGPNADPGRTYGASGLRWRPHIVLPQQLTDLGVADLGEISVPRADGEQLGRCMQADNLISVP
jgi:hypothetical protein